MPINNAQPKGWKETTLGEHIEIVGGGTPTTSTQEYWNGDIPWLSVADFNEKGRWVYNADKHISQKGVENSATRILNKGDLIISARGTVGALAQFGRPMAFSQSCYGIRARKTTNNDFLYYLIKHNISQLLKNVHGAVFDTITRDTFDQIQILLPPYSEQVFITDVLSVFDKKIELLWKQNETLEQMARTIFHEWFVAFNFPNEQGKPYKTAGGKMVESELGDIPEGWRVGVIDDLCEKLASGGTPSTQNVDYYGGNISWFSTKELNDNFLFESEKTITNIGLENSSAKLFPHGTILMAIYAAPTVGRLGILATEATFNQAAVGLIAKEAVCNNAFIYLFLLHSREALNNLANGAAQQNLNVGLIRNFPVIIPDSKAMNVFRGWSEQVFNKMFSNASQLRELARLRDTLLPKLMSGEVRVNI